MTVARSFIALDTTTMTPKNQVGINKRAPPPLSKIRTTLTQPKPMSDPTPFLEEATAIDKVVLLELIEDNQALRQQLQQARKVQITSGSSSSEAAPDASPPVVYAQAQFDENGTSDGDVWRVRFPVEEIATTPRSTTTTTTSTCPLATLEDIRLFLGGAEQPSFQDCRAFVAHLYEDETDHDNGKVVYFAFSGSSMLYLIVRVDGWPRDLWQQMIAPAEEDPEKLGLYLLTVLPTEEPTNKMVTFLEVSFDENKVRGIIENH